MRKTILIVALASGISGVTQTRASPDLSSATDRVAQPMVIGGKIHISPGSHVVLRNVDFSRPFPEMTIKENGTVIIDGSGIAPADARR
jgi:hypothetical protein